MKKFILIVSVLLAGNLLAESIAIFERHDSRVIGSSAADPKDSAQTVFWAGYSRDRSDKTAYEAELPLVSPPEWGKTVSADTGGIVRYHRNFKHGFVCQLRLHNLAPDHTYILTLNGNPEKAGNALLRTPVPGNEIEKYYDFLDVKTDAHGSYEADLGIFLTPGDYDVRLYVKDTADFKIVLYRDFFKFVVE